MRGFKLIYPFTGVLLLVFVFAFATVASARAAAEGNSLSDQQPQAGEITRAEAGFIPEKKTPAVTAAIASTLSMAAPSAPFNECPAVGYDTSCALLGDVTDSGVTILRDPSQGPYDGGDDTLIGVLNQSSKSLGHLSLASTTEMFGFDGDGICSYEYTIDPGCPFGYTGYEGPGTSFTELSADRGSGVVNFEPAVPPGGTSYFSLEEPLSASTVVSGGPQPIEQGGAPNRSERRTTCSKGHPVNCATGVFWHEFVDAQVPGRGVPLEFTRTYSSMNAAEDGPLGYGWSDSYGMSLSVDGETGAATINEEAGSAVTFPSNGEGGFTTPPRVLATLAANEDGTYTFSRFSDHISYIFSTAGTLLREVDRNGNTTTLSYSGGLLERVTDPAGRSLTFAYSGSRIHTITDPMGRTMTFSYDASGNLNEASDPMGRTWRFTYDGSHRMLTMTNPRGGVISNTYDGSGRVIAQVDPMGRESTWQYEGEAATSEGGVTTFTDALGAVTRYGYRDLELRSVTRGVGTDSEGTTSYEYDPITLGVTSVTDPNGDTTHNRYDSHGNLIETMDPLYRTADYEYGPMDELLYAWDPAGTPTSYRYDGNGNLLEKETPDYSSGELAITRYGYEAEPGEVTKVTNPDGSTTTFGYDASGDRISATDGDGNKTTFTFNADGEMTSKVSPAGNEPGGNPAAHTSSFVYNADGELINESDQLGHSTTYGYDAAGNQTSVTDANGHTTHQSYDADNEQTEVIRTDGSTLKTTWDAAGNMTGQVDGAGHTTSYSYDALDRLVGVTDPNGHTTSYAYDSAGNKVESTDPEGQATYYGYDSADQLTSIEFSDGITPSVYEEYDQDGNRVQLTDGTGTSTFTYDSLNRMTRAEDGSGATVGYEYDRAGHLTKITYPNGESVTRTVDPAGNLASVTDWLGHTTHFSYDADSNLKEEEYGNGVKSQLAYDNADRIMSINDSRDANQLATFSYTRDPLGQVTSAVDQNGQAETINYARNSLDQLTEAGSAPYGYDAADNPTTFGAATQHFDPANELTSSSLPTTIEEEAENPGGGGGGGGSLPGGAGTPPNSETGPPPSEHRSRFHCRKGFKKKKVRGKRKCIKAKKKRHHHSKHHAHASSALGTSGRPGTGHAAVRHGPAIASASASVIGSGSATVKPETSSTVITRQFEYNERGDRVLEELANGDPRFLTFDQANRLVEVGNDVSYSYNGDGLRVAKTVGGVTTGEVWNEAEAQPELLEAGATSYIYGPGGQPIEEISGGAPTFMQSDQQGSIRLLTDATGAVTGRYDYDAWGSVTRHTGTGESELQFDGQLTDAETGYQYLRARYYDQRTAQFLSQDPAYLLTRARYAFGNNDPPDVSDPTGLSFCLLGHVSSGGCRGGGVLQGALKTGEDLLDVVCLRYDLGILCVQLPPGLNLPGSGSPNGQLADISQLGVSAEDMHPVPLVPSACLEPLAFKNPL